MHETPPSDLDFAAASAVVGSSRRYSASIDPSWSGPAVPNGGLLQAIMLRAIDAELGPESEFQARSTSCHFLRAPSAGSVEIFIDPLRRGRRFASFRGTLSQGGKACIAMLATYSVRGIEDMARWSPAPPEVTPPPVRSAESVDLARFRDAGPEVWLSMPEQAPPFLRRLLSAPRFGSGPFQGRPVDPFEGAASCGWVMARSPQAVEPAWLAFLVDAVMPPVLGPLKSPALTATIEMTTYIRPDIPPEGLPDQALLVHSVTRSVQNGMCDADYTVYSSGGDLLAQGRQLQLLQPIEV